MIHSGSINMNLWATLRDDTEIAREKAKRETIPLSCRLPFTLLLFVQLIFCTSCGSRDSIGPVEPSKHNPLKLEPDEQSAPASSSAIAIDDVTGLVLVTQSNGVILAHSQAGQFKGAVDDGKPVEDINAGSGYACMSQPPDGQISVWNLKRLFARRLVSRPVGKNPGNVWMTTLPREGPVCAVYDRSVPSIWIVKIPSMELSREILLSGLSPVEKLPPLQGGWRLTGFSTGSAKGIAALLSVSDRKVAFVDLEEGKQTRVIDIPNIPVQVAADTTHAELIIASVEERQRLTRFSRVDPRTGKLEVLSKTSTVSPAGLVVSKGGESIFIYDSENHETIPNE